MCVYVCVCACVRVCVCVYVCERECILVTARESVCVCKLFIFYGENGETDWFVVETWSHLWYFLSYHSHSVKKVALSGLFEIAN